MELSETYRVSFQNKSEKSVHLVGLIIRIFVTMHGHMNVNIYIYIYIFNIHRPTSKKSDKHEELVSPEFDILVPVICSCYWYTLNICEISNALQPPKYK
jgi:hypothetical protein